MKKFLGLIYVCFFISFSVLGQEGVKRDVNKIDKLSSISRPEEVEAIISGIDKRYTKFRVNTAVSFADENCFRLTDLSKVTAITKADFDKNGFTDLLVMGMLDKHPVTVSLMGSADNKVSMHIITKHYRRTCSVAKVIYESGNTLIEHIFFKTYYARIAENEVVNVQKLVFKFGDFIEYNPAPKKYNIEKIEYKNDGGVWIPNSAFSIELNSDRKGRYSNINPDFLSRRNNEYINFHGMIPDTTYNEITGLLNYSDFPNLNDSYAVTATDHSTGSLKITFDGGKIKTIKDYGMIGTHSLSRAYQILDSLREIIVWSQVPTKELIPLPIK